MGADPDFSAQFYNLEGLHYNERKKNFHKLLNSTDLNVLRKHTDLIQPRNYLERIFYVDILIRAKHVEKLMGILQEGSGVLTSRILKQKWFFQEAFEDMSEDQLVNDFLPTLSFSLRMKVLKKISLAFSEERMDKVFDSILQRYGLFIAQNFLFGCTKAKILDTLKNNEMTLSIEQLKRILDKDSGILQVYFEEYEKNTGSCFADRDFISYALWKYPKLYFEFQGGARVGRQTTKALLKIDEKGTLKKLMEGEKSLNTGTIARRVRDFDKDYAHAFLPSNMEELFSYWLPDNVRNCLKIYPVKKRWGVFSRAFNKKYNEDARKYLHRLALNLISSFATDIQEQWAELNFQETDDLPRYVPYFEPKRAFALVKKRVNLISNINERTTIVRALVRICHAHKDYKTYEEVLKYICTRHLNEDRYFRNELLSDISNNIDLKLSTETLWVYINELINFMRAKGEDLPFKNTCQYIMFCFEKQLPWHKAVAQYVNDVVAQKGTTWHFGFFSKEPEIKAHVILSVMKLLPLAENHDKRKTLALKLMKDLNSFNQDHGDLCIDLNEGPVIVDFIKKAVAKNNQYDQEDTEFVVNLLKYNYSKPWRKDLRLCSEAQLLDVVKAMTHQGSGARQFRDVIFEALKEPRSTKFQSGLLEYYFSSFIKHPRCGKEDFLNYFIGNELEVVVEYFDEILPLELEESALDFELLKLLSHLSLDVKTVSYFKPLVSVDSTCESKVNLIENLSEFMATDEYLDLIAPYVPDKNKDLGEDAKQKVYGTRCAIAKSLKNLDEMSKIIPVLYRFCQGDFLQPTLPLLYKVLYRISEKQASTVINALTERAVSARKHAVYLSFEVLPQKSSLNLFNAISIKETNVSAKKYLFQGILKYFLRNSSDCLLDIVLRSMVLVDKNDKEVLRNVVSSLGKVPLNFKRIYAEHIWGFFDALEQKEVNVKEYRASLISAISEYNLILFSQFTDKFFRDVMARFFLSDQNDSLKGLLNDFVAKHLLVRKDDEHFMFVFDIIRNYKQFHWESEDADKLKLLFKFFDRTYSKYLAQDLEFLKLFKTYWEQVFSHEEAFCHYVLLDLMDSFKTTSNLGQLTENINKIFQQILIEYGPGLNDLLLWCVQRLFSNGALRDTHDYAIGKFALRLLQLERSEFNCFLAARIVESFDREEQVRSQIIDILKSVNTPAVRVRTNKLRKEK